MMEDNKLALELLHEVKKTSKRYFILFIITLALMFISNAIWLYAWYLPVEETTTTSTTVDQTSSDNSNNTYINEGGEVNYGETNSN